MTILDALSRFNKTPPIIYDGKLTYGYWDDYEWLRNRPETQFIRRFYVSTAYEGRPDLIANSVYSNPKLDWVIIAFNVRMTKTISAQKVLNWPKAGVSIEYPDSSIVIPSLLSPGN